MGMRTYSACVPSMVLPRIHPPSRQWEYICLRQKSHFAQAVTQEMSTLSPLRKVETGGAYFVDDTSTCLRDLVGCGLG